MSLPENDVNMDEPSLANILQALAQLQRENDLIRQENTLIRSALQRIHAQTPPVQPQPQYIPQQAAPQEPKMGLPDKFN